MPLSLCGKCLSHPSSIGRCFRMTYIKRPVQREWRFTKHSPVKPVIAVFHPEERMMNSKPGNPSPAFICPETAIFITSGLDESQIITLCDAKSIQHESWDCDAMNFKLIIPSKNFFARQSQCCFSGRNFNHAVLDGPPSRRRRLRKRGSRLPLERKLVKQIDQSFRVHQAVFNRNIQKRGQR